MTTGTKRQWARIGLAVAAILLLALCFGLSGPLDRALTYRTVDGEGVVVDQALTQNGQYALVLRRDTDQPYLLLYCDEAQWHRVQPGDCISFRARLSERLNEGTVRELTVLSPASPDL